MTRKSRSSPGAVYILAHESWPGYLKIGCAKNPRKRLATYQCGCPHHGYRLVNSVWVPDMYWTEAGAHSILFLSRVAGEWFKTTHRAAFSAIIQADAGRTS